MSTFFIALSFVLASFIAVQDFKAARHPTRFYSEVVTTSQPHTP